MSKLIVTLIFVTLFTSCKKEAQNPKEFYQLINKEWFATNQVEASYIFFENDECLIIRKYGTVIPGTYIVTPHYDSTFAYWHLKNNTIFFSESKTFSNKKPDPLDWHIVELHDTLLRVKLVAEKDNPYIVPFTFRAINYKIK